FTNSNAASSFNTDRVEASLGTPIPFTKNKLTLFTNVSAFLTDEYFGATASQLNSSLFPETSDFWAPRQTNSYTHTLKLAYKIRSGTKITVTNQHSLNINQNTRSLQIVGFDAILTPGFQYERSLNLDNATTYTHHSNLTILNVNHLVNKNWGVSLALGRLFTNLRADANGRPFRYETVDQILDEENIITDPVQVFNPNDPSGVYYVLPGNGLYNNGGISPTWHDHYAEEYTINAKATYIPSKVHEISFGIQQAFKEYQWVDVNRPWVGAPIRINDSVTTPSVSIGSSNDIWNVNPVEGGIFFQDKITYKGIIASLGLRMNFWAPGTFADDAVNNPNAPVIDQVREDYKNKTANIFGLRWKARFLPKINVSFPVTENNVLYFNYGHSMRLPHPRFLYAGLDPVYQDRSFLSNLGNPDLDPEVNVSYEIGLKSKITRDLAMTITAFNNNRFDYIVSRSVLVRDQTGRTVTKTFYINQDYAKIYGVEFGLNYRIGKYFRSFTNIAYQVARGKSNSARESALQIEQNGEVSLTREQFLRFDRPWNVNLGVVFVPCPLWV
ncbi:MAG: TonB-dependent receptor domain-containing protein, partial [Owenweeksia sp.]